MKLDTNRAWQEAAAAVSSSREVLAAVAGVFFLLPSLAFALMVQPPATAEGATPAAAMAVLQEYYLSVLPWMVPVTLLQAAGTLAVLALLSPHARPTVGEAIRQGVLGLFPYIAAQLLFGMALGFMLVVGVGLPAAAGAMAISVLLGLGIGAFAIYATIKTVLVGPVIMIEGERNPVAALARSWQLTSGNSARILVFYLLLGIAFLIVLGVASAVVGAVAALIGGASAGTIAGAIVQSVLGAAMTLYLTAVSMAIHRQLTGSGISATFE